MRLRSLIFPILACGVNAYFGYHLLHGKHGLEGRETLDQRARTLEHELATLRATRIGIERDIALLTSDKIDPDMLDERARAILNLAHPEDFVVMQPSNGELNR